MNQSSDPNVPLMESGSVVQPGRQFFLAVKELTGFIDIPEQPTITAGYADIYRGFWTNPQGEPVQVAIKQLRIIPKDRHTDQEALKWRAEMRLKREVFVWSQTKHPNLHPLLGYRLHPQPRLVSPWCHHGNLTDYLQANLGLTRCDKLRLIFQTACGLEHLHSRTPPICHADIKPENVLINDCHCPALSDFGLSRVVQELGAGSGFTTSDTVGGTLRYMASELSAGQKPDLDSDVYAFGGLILTVMSGKAPFDGLPHQVILRRVMQDQPPIPKDHPNLPAHDPLWELMRRCWNNAPAARPKMREVRLELSEKFIREESYPLSRLDPASVTDDGAREDYDLDPDVPGALQHGENLPLLAGQPAFGQQTPTAAMAMRMRAMQEAQQAARMSQANMAALNFAAQNAVGGQMNPQLQQQMAAMGMMGVPAQAQAQAQAQATAAASPRPEQQGIVQNATQAGMLSGQVPMGLNVGQTPSQQHVPLPNQAQVNQNQSKPPTPAPTASGLPIQQQRPQQQQQPQSQQQIHPHQYGQPNMLAANNPALAAAAAAQFQQQHAQAMQQHAQARAQAQAQAAQAQAQAQAQATAAASPRPGQQGIAQNAAQLRAGQFTFGQQNPTAVMAMRIRAMQEAQQVARMNQANMTALNFGAQNAVGGQMNPANAMNGNTAGMMGGINGQQVAFGFGTPARQAYLQRQQQLALQASMVRTLQQQQQQGQR